MKSSSLYGHIEFVNSVDESKSPHRRSTEIEFEFESNYFIHRF